MVLLTEVSAEVEPLSSGTPLVADDTPVWARLDAELLVAARERCRHDFVVRSRGHYVD